MAPLSRQERLQMRQRGAGARKVNNVDFGLSFGLTTAGVERSAKQTPRSSHATIRRPSKTPSRSDGRSSARRSVRSASAPIDTIENEANKLVGLGEHSDAHAEAPSLKRRKTKDGYISQPATPAHLTGSSSASIGASSKAPSIRNSKTRRRTSGPVFVHIAEDPENEMPPGPLEQNTGISKESNQRRPESDIEAITIDKENAIPDEREHDDEPVAVDKPKRRSRKRKSIGQQSQRKKTRPSNGSVLSRSEESLRDEAASQQVEEELEWETMIDDDPGSLPEVTSTASPPNSSLSKKRRKRKSIVIKPRRRKRPGDFSIYRTVSPPGLPRDDNARLRDTDQQVIPADPTTRVQSHTTTRRRISGVSNVGTPSSEPAYEPEMDGDETYFDEAVSPEKPTPKAPLKRRNAKAGKGRRLESNVRHRSSRQADPSSTVKSSTLTFPIVTHRMTNISALPTINDDAEDDPSHATNISSAKTMFSDRSVPNAIDVLAQICRETISNTLSKQSGASSTTSAREIKRKRTAIEAFGSEIDSRLFDMSVAIEHRLTMEARVKKAKKAKADAQNEWMAIRRQREEIALQCDDVRARNLRAETDGKEAYELSEQLHGLEMIVEKPELDSMDLEASGLEFMLRDVAMTVSGAAGGGVGLLDRVKEYNRQLERTALVLEGRHLD